MEKATDIFDIEPGKIYKIVPDGHHFGNYGKRQRFYVLFDNHFVLRDAAMALENSFFFNRSNRKNFLYEIETPFLVVEFKPLQNLAASVKILTKSGIGYIGLRRDMRIQYGELLVEVD